MSSSAERNTIEPPPAITLACLLGFAWWSYMLGAKLGLRLLNLPTEGLLANPPGASLGPTIFQGVCLGAIWSMRRWGVQTYAVIAAFHQAAYVLSGQWTWWWMIVPLIVVAVGAAYSRRMQP